MSAEQTMEIRENDLVSDGVDSETEVAAIRGVDSKRHAWRNCPHIKRKQVMILPVETLEDRNLPCKTCHPEL